MTSFDSRQDGTAADSNHIQVLRMRAEAAFQKTDFHLAIQDAEAVLAQSPDDAWNVAPVPCVLRPGHGSVRCGVARSEVNSLLSVGGFSGKREEGFILPIPSDEVICQRPVLAPFAGISPNGTSRLGVASRSLR